MNQWIRPVRFASLWTLIMAVLCSDVTATGGALYTTDVFISGQNGYHTCRIPAIVQATNGRLLAFAEGRKFSGSDTGDIDLVKIDGVGGGLLFEKGITSNYQRITFARFDIEWLDDPSYLYMDFENQLTTDLRGNGTNGIIEGSPSFVPGDPRYGGGSAIHFNGDDEKVRIDDVTDGIFDFEAENSFTLEVVFRTTNHGNGGANGSGPLISKDVGSNTPSYWLRLQDGKARFSVDDDSVSSSATSSADVTDGLWHHLAAVRDAENSQLRLYLDYTLVATVADTTSGDFGNSTDLLLGAFNDSSPGIKRFNGDIDLARVSAGALDPLEFVLPDALPGDFDLDGDVDLDDFNILSSNMYGCGLSYPDGDATGDGLVNMDDFVVLSQHFGMTLNETIQVPAPWTTVLMLIVCPSWIIRNR